jgi:hypothetical protein
VPLRDDRSVMELRGYGASAAVTGRPEGAGGEFAHLIADSRIILVGLAFAPIDRAVALCCRRSLEVRAMALNLTAIDVVDQTSSATTDLEVDLLRHHGAASGYREESTHETSQHCRQPRISISGPRSTWSTTSAATSARRITWCTAGSRHSTGLASAATLQQRNSLL